MPARQVRAAPHNALVPPAQTVSTGTPPPSSATSTASYTSAGAKLALPSAGGYTGTVALPASGVLGTATMTMTSNTAIPSGVPTILDRRRASADRRTLSSVIAPQFYETLNSSDTVVFNGYPTFAITAPATVSVGASAFYLATYDPTGTGTWTDLGRMTAYRQTLTSVVYASTLGLHGNVNYLYAMYSFPLEHPTSPFASASCPTPALAAVSSNDILWCAAGDGFEKISSGGSSFIYLPDVTYTVEGITRGPDGNVWFTAATDDADGGEGRACRKGRRNQRNRDDLCRSQPHRLSEFDHLLSGRIDYGRAVVAVFRHEPPGWNDEPGVPRNEQRVGNGDEPRAAPLQDRARQLHRAHLWERRQRLARGRDDQPGRT